MIGTIDIKVNAAKPNFPLSPFYAFVNSPSQVRVINVPKAIGSWSITKVFVTANYPDNTSTSVECSLDGGCWHGTLPACSVVGSAANGFAITANGVKEDGTTAVTGYVLGKGDIQILTTDGTITPGETTYYIHILSAQPTTPQKGDAYVDAGSWKVYNGSQWVTLGGVFGAAQYVQYPTTEGGDGKWHRVIISDGAIAYDEIGVDEPPTCATQSWVTTQIAAETTARTAAISAEATARQSADQTNADAIEAEATARATAVSAEASARASADEAEVTNRNSAISSAIATEVTNRNSAISTAVASEATARDSAISTAVASEATARDSAISTAVASEASLRQSGDSTNADAISAEATARQTADAAEVTARNSAISSAIATEVTNRNSAISAEATARQNADAAEVTARNAAIAQAVAVEEARAVAVENALEEDIDDEISRATAAESAEASARAAADATKVSLDGAQTVNGVKTFTSPPIVPTPTADMQTATKKYADDVVMAEATARANADSAEVTNRNSAISSAIATEVTNRNSAISTAVASEATARDSAISTAVASEASLRQSGDSTNADAISAEATARQTADAAEVTARNSAISSAIATEVSDRNSAIATETSARTAAISAEATARASADEAEVTNRNAAISALTTDLTNNLVHKTGAETITGMKTFAYNITSQMGLSAEGGSIELGQGLSGSATNGGFIDFHYAGSAEDFTVRIINSGASNRLAILPQTVTGSVLTTTMESLKGAAFANAAMPSSSVLSGLATVDATSTAQQTLLTDCPVNGWAIVRGVSARTDNKMLCYCLVGGAVYAGGGGWSTAAGAWCNITIPIVKGSTIAVQFLGEEGVAMFTSVQTLLRKCNAEVA